MSVKRSNKTKQYKFKYNLLQVIDVLFTVGPLLAIALYGLISGTIVVHKVALSMTMIIWLMFTLVALVNKVVFKSKIWILIIGFYICITNAIIPIIIVGITQILSEVVIGPLKKQVFTKFTINKEIDERNE